MTSARVPDVNGWYTIQRNPISKVGVFPYSAGSIKAPGWETNPGRIVSVYRPESELSDPETVASFRLVPWTDDHAMLGDPEKIPGTMPAEKKGVQGVIGEQTFYDPETRTLYGNLKIFGRQLARIVDAGKRELSCGFRCVYEHASGNFEGQPYDAIQRTIRGNHIATVSDGRMGPGVAVLDHLSFAFDEKDVVPMNKTLRQRLMNALGITDPAKLTAAIAANPTALVAAMDAEEKAEGEGDGKKDPTLKDIAAMLEGVAPVMATIQKAIATLGGGAPEPDGDELAPGADAVPPPVDPNAPPKPPAAAVDATPPALATMDARLKTAEATIADFRKAAKAPTMKDLLSEVAARDALAGKLSGFVGAFDHSEMTLADVAKYGVDKLGIKGVPVGHEQTALNSYLHGRTPEHKSNVFAFDSAREPGKSKVAAYLTPKNAA